MRASCCTLFLCSLALCFSLSSARIQDYILKGVAQPHLISSRENAPVQNIVFSVLNLGAYTIQLRAQYLDADMTEKVVLTDPVEEFGTAIFLVPPRSLDVSVEVLMVGHGSIFHRTYPNSRAMVAVCTKFQVLGTVYKPQWQFRCT